ncbi:ABC transporter permease [uncultured Parasphingorhabdus sp.]|uniref:ABC transporter permease n=1 Tax=uncultured Parasphingorhabdus sp. TaxID=2709694 RepID=UPI002AA8968F|nr:ABC transporter permease [uncultured Parasphingorhabdus sp.]
MLQFAIRQLIWVPITLLLVITVTFFVLRLTGDPATLYLDATATPEQLDILRRQLGLDKPLIVQYGRFLGDILTLDFGHSLQFQAPAINIVIGRLGATFVLIVASLFLSLVLGLVGGLVSAIYKDRAADVAISTFAVVGQSMPSFWLGILLVQLFSLQLGWLPTSGTGGWLHLVLPATTLAAFITPNLILITRTAVLEASAEQFVTTAKAKGLGPIYILVRHILPNAMNPIISFFGMQVGRLVGGSVVTETIFAWPGIGRLMIGAVYQRDVPVVVATVTVTCLAIILANLVVSLMLAAADPRIKLN